ncbi:MAG TPA: ABC transporter permease, partial [Vicinamibacterales bacterium]|nr:ABC transporter permease [Vicinamibacterales bacterium]
MLQDLRFALRALRATPIVTASAILSLALGIGANTAIFSVVNAILLRPLRAPDADRLVRFAETYHGTPSWSIDLARYNQWRQETSAFDDISAHWSELANLTNGSYPEQVSVGRVTAGFFGLFGARAIKGHVFAADEDRPGGRPVVVLSHELWRRQFAADPEIVGKAVVLGGESRSVVGVIAPNFDSEQFADRPDVWIPFQIDPNAPEKGPLCYVTGRLRSDVTVDAAQAELQIVTKNMPRPGEPTDVSRSALAVPLQEAMVGDIRSGLLILASAVGCVLLIACANVAGLLLIRAVDQRRDVAIRAAIGAARSRIARQVLFESLVMALVSGVLALFLGT